MVQTPTCHFLLNSPKFNSTHNSIVAAALAAAVAADAGSATAGVGRCRGAGRLRRIFDKLVDIHHKFNFDSSNIYNVDETNKEPRHGKPAFFARHVKHTYAPSSIFNVDETKLLQRWSSATTATTNSITVTTHVKVIWSFKQLGPIGRRRPLDGPSSRPQQLVGGGLCAAVRCVESISKKRSSTKDEKMRRTKRYKKVQQRRSMAKHASYVGAAAETRRRSTPSGDLSCSTRPAPMASVRTKSHPSAHRRSLLRRSCCT